MLNHRELQYIGLGLMGFTSFQWLGFCMVSVPNIRSNMIFVIFFIIPLLLLILWGMSYAYYASKKQDRVWTASDFMNASVLPLAIALFIIISLSCGIFLGI